MSPRDRGFTLIEIAIVLVIIGLLLGSVLAGPQLIRNAKVENLIVHQTPFGAYMQLAFDGM